MNYKTVLFFTILSFYLSTSCSRMGNKEIQRSWWKYGSGSNIGDALRFDDYNNLKGDTIYYSNKPIAIILSCGKEIFRENAVLKIKNLKTGEIGIYHEKGKH